MLKHNVKSNPYASDTPRHDSYLSPASIIHHQWAATVPLFCRNKQTIYVNGLR